MLKSFNIGQHFNIDGSDVLICLNWPGNGRKSVAKFKKLFEIGTKSLDLKKHIPVSVTVCNRSVSVVLVLANVKVTAKRLDHYFGITSCDRLFGSNR